MARYALVYVPSLTIVAEKDESRIDLSAGIKPDYKWCVVQNELVDLSTPDNTDTKSSTAEFIEPAQDRVRRVRTVVDKTAQEISDEKDQIVAQIDTPSRDMQYASLILTKEILSLIFNVVNELRAADGDAPLTLAQFNTFFQNNKDSISNTQYKNYLKDRFG